MMYNIAELKMRLAQVDTPLTATEIEALYQALRCLEIVAGPTGVYLQFGVRENLTPTAKLPDAKKIATEAKKLVAKGLSKLQAVKELRDRYRGLGLREALDVVNEAWPKHS